MLKALDADVGGGGGARRKAHLRVGRRVKGLAKPCRAEFGDGLAIRLPRQQCAVEAETVDSSRSAVEGQGLKVERKTNI